MDLADDLQNCLEEMLSGRSTVDGALLRRPQAAAELRPLLLAASLMQQAAQVSLSAPARAEGERRFLAQAAELSKRRRLAGRVHFLQKLALGLLVVILAFAVVDYAAASSLPGDLLYPIKLAEETVRLAITPADQRPWLNLEFGQTRLTEIERLAVRGHVDGSALAALAKSNAAAESALPTADPQGRAALSASLLSHLEVQQTVLQSLAQQVSPMDKPLLDRALEQTDEMENRVRSGQIIPMPHSTPLPPTPAPQGWRDDHSFIEQVAWRIDNSIDQGIVPASPNIARQAAQTITQAILQQGRKSLTPASDLKDAKGVLRQATITRLRIAHIQSTRSGNGGSGSSSVERSSQPAPGRKPQAAGAGNQLARNSPSPGRPAAQPGWDRVASLPGSDHPPAQPGGDRVGPVPGSNPRASPANRRPNPRRPAQR